MPFFDRGKVAGVMDSFFLFWIISYSPYETARQGIGQRTEDLESIGSPPATREVVDGGAGLRKRQLAMVGESKRDRKWGEICAPRRTLSARHTEWRGRPTFGP